MADKLPVPTLFTEDGHPLIPGAELLELSRVEAVTASAAEVAQHVGRYLRFLEA